MIPGMHLVPFEKIEMRGAEAEEEEVNGESIYLACQIQLAGKT